MAAAPLALFDLDHTLLDGDSDVLWCEFLIERGLLDRAAFETRNLAMAAAYHAGTVSAQEFCEFYVGTLAGHTAREWQGLRENFFAECIATRLLDAGREVIAWHRDEGHTLVLTTATNRYITELSAISLDIPNLIATECATDADGRFTGAVAGRLNMREGKVERLRAWLAAEGRPPLEAHESWCYSDSINDLPLLAAVMRAHAVDPDPRLATEALARGWPVLHWRRPA